jgi:hypothetical protein
MTIDFGIIITGLINDTYSKSLIETYKNVNLPKIISTWLDQDTKKLEDNGFIILKNSLPERGYNYKSFQTNVQVKATKLAVDYLEENFKNVTHVIRLRTDLHVPKFYDLLNILENKIISEDKITVIAGTIHEYKNSFIDLIFAGSMKNINAFLNFHPDTDFRCIEVFLSETYCGKSNLSKEEMKDKFNFFMKELYDNDVEIFWLKYMKDIKDHYNRGLIYF